MGTPTSRRPLDQAEEGNATARKVERHYGLMTVKKMKPQITQTKFQMPSNSQRERQGGKRAGLIHSTTRRLSLTRRGGSLACSVAISHAFLFLTCSPLLAIMPP